MLNDTENLELKPLLRRLLYRGLLIFVLVLMASLMLSMVIRSYLQEQFAEHLSQTVRNDLLIGNNAAALKILQQNISGNFSRISYHDRQMVLFVLKASPETKKSFLEGSTRIPICLKYKQVNCPAGLVYQYSLLHYIPMVLLAAGVALLIFFLVFWIFRQHVAAYYREQLKSHKEAALGRLSARICHDLKLPTMIFQRVAYMDNADQFKELRPQLQSHLHRLHAMIEKLKKAELEGLVHMASHILERKDLQSFLSSIAPTPQQLQITMNPTVQVYLDMDKFERSLANLVLNAFQAGATLVKLSLNLEERDLIVLVENDGPEIPAGIIQGFLRTDRNILQQSLGLRIVRDTVLAHGGSFDVESDSKRTLFTLRFPNSVLEFQSLDFPQMLSNSSSPSSIDQSSLIWMDESLITVARGRLSKAESDPFEFTSDPATLARVQLLISRQGELIDQAIQYGVPIIMPGTSPDDFGWIDGLRSRLRLLKLKQSKSMSLSQLNSVQMHGQNPPAPVQESPEINSFQSGINLAQGLKTSN